MALKIYPDEGISSSYSQDGGLSNAFRQAFDGRSGTIREVRLYLRNDDVLYTYAQITIQPVVLSGRNIIDGTDGYSWKLSAGDTQPISDEWRGITAGASISMSDISDITTYSPFWVRIEVPRGAPVE
ncbi:hypothetical protein DRQ25_13850, partial [Candidatus Fermentibacteria bacterium]